MQNSLIDFFILGYPRSGTSLLRMTMNGHSQIKVNPECSFVTYLSSDYLSIEYPMQVSTLQEFVSELQQCRKFDTWNLNSEYLIEKLLDFNPNSYGELCAQVYQLHEPGKAIKVLGDKNNVHIFEVEKLLSIFPHTKLLYVVRDPRDVYSSLKHVAQSSHNSRYAPRPKLSLEEFCKDWKGAYKPLLENNFFEGKNLKGLLTIKYEDFVCEYSDSVSRIFRFLEVDEFLDLDRLNTQSIHLIGHDEPEELMSWKKMTSEPVNKHRLGQWKTSLTLEEMRFINNCLKNELTFFEYN